MAKWLLFLWSVILLIQIHGHRGCHVKERMSLLQFKAYVKSNGFDIDDLLPSWVEDPQSDCCLWDRVTCSNITRRVIHLSFGSIMKWSREINAAPLNISIFQAFKELRVLDLSDNGINGWIEEEGYGGTLRLQHLETLDLCLNLFTDSSSLRSLSHLTSLKNLYLCYNGIEGHFPARGMKLSALGNLESLDLELNALEGSLTVQDLKYLSKLSKLEYLYLHDNNFNKDILRCLGSLPSLKSLGLSWNHMEGSLADQDLKTLPRLEMLDLRSNNLVGNIPSKLWDPTTIRAISLADNKFNGPFPDICELSRLEELDISGNSLDGILPSCLKYMTSLRYVDLTGNHFDGSFNFSSLANHSKLEAIMLTCDGDKLKTDAEYLDQIPLFHLEVLRLSNCNLESVPKFLHHQHRLRAIDLSHNKLNGTFPTWFAESHPELELLNLRGNCFSGQLYLPTNSMRNIYSVDISSNQLHGQLQDDFGKIFSNAKSINLSYNHFEGELPRSICATGKLRILDLSNNKFSGEVQVFTSCTNLELLHLSHNKFQGEILSTYFDFNELSRFKLNDNQFTGNLSLLNIFDKAGYFDVFDISNNKFEGEIPSSIFNLYGEVLVLRNNSFEGQFPCTEKTLDITYLDLSYNSFRGPLPYCFDQDSLKQLHLQGNQFSGSIPSPLFSFPALKVLNLKQNNLVGSIPFSINGTTLPSLRILLLGNNFVNGSIPELFCRIKNISIMDLSNNNFSGPAPQCFYNISWGKVDIASIYDSPSQEFLSSAADISGYQVQANVLSRPIYFGDSDLPVIEVEVDFVTKDRLNLYQGDPLNLMSGLDLSCNSLTGEIPSAFGNFSSIHALNLSHNRLVGSIPISFLKLAQIESLDLSYNHLSGRIPSELVNLYFLQVFSVAHNNLSGEIPQSTQFSTFNDSSFEGNPLLCGMPLTKTCSTPLPPYPPIVLSEESEGKWFEVDSIAFYASSAVTYVVVLLASATVLYLNPFWRRRWFLFIEDFLDSSYYFVYGTLNKLWN